MSGIPTVFGDGVLDVHVASGVARITLGAQTGGKDAKPTPSAMLVVPVMQLPNLARVLVEVTKQIDARAKEAIAQQQKEAASGNAEAAPAADADHVAGAFRFNG
jgi:hypothetical protein